MTRDEFAELLKGVNDAEFEAKMDSANSAEEAIAVLKDYGIIITASELESFFSQPSASELSDSELCDVTGGTILKYLSPFYWLGRLIVKGGGNACKKDDND